MVHRGRCSLARGMGSSSDASKPPTKVEIIYQLRISAIYSSDSSNRSRRGPTSNLGPARYRAQVNPGIAFSPMETAILLGIPSPYVARLRNALDSQGGLPETWSLLFVPAPKKNPEINRGTVRQACQFADKHASPHIFGFSTQQQRCEWAGEIAPYFRFRWCDPLVRLLKCLATPNPTPFPGKANR